MGYNVHSDLVNERIYSDLESTCELRSTGYAFEMMSMKARFSAVGTYIAKLVLPIALQERCRLVHFCVAGHDSANGSGNWQ